MTSEHVSRQLFAGISVMIVTTSTVATIAMCESMSAMGGMPMPGDWTMSMTWMWMPGQTWTNLAASFLGMWIAMMVAMMWPSVAPVLWRYRAAMERGGRQHSGWLAALAGAGYFFTWATLGVLVFAAGMLLAIVEMQSPWLSHGIPAAAGAVVLIAGALQFTRWKTHHLECCRVNVSSCHTWPSRVHSAWQFGLRLGIHCCLCCAGLTAILLVVGVMDLRAMLAITAAITLERLAPAAWRAAQVIGVVAIATGLVFMGRAIGLG
jgi:predicted metal-binding membrane protein